MAPLGRALRTLGTRTANAGRMLFGRAPVPPPRPYQEMGVAGTAVYGGYVQIKERSPDWVGRQKWVTAADLAVNTSIVAAGVHYFLNLVAYPEWTFRPHDEEDEESLALAEFCDDVFQDMTTPFYKIIRRAAMYRFHGFGVQEWTAKHRDDGLVGFKDIEARPQHTIEQWDVDFDGTVLGMWQRSPQTGTLLGLPRDKVLYLVEDTLTDSPEGIGMFRHMADPWQRLKQLQELEIRAYERDLRGTPIARAPLTFIQRAVKQKVLTAAEASALVAKFENLVQIQVKQSDTGLVLDSLPYFSDSDAGDQVSGVPQWGFELLSGAGVGHAEIAAAIDRVQREIARIIGVEHLMMGDTGGNRALSEDKSRNLYLIANSVLKYIAEQVKSDLLVPLWKLNGFPMDKMPQPKPEDVTFKNAEAITNALGKLASAGAPLAPNDPVINDIRDLLGISRVPEDLAMQGALQQPNALLAGLPPELQALAMGGAGAAEPPGAGGSGAGPGGGKPGMPTKPGKGGGKPFTGKRKEAKRPEDDADPKLEGISDDKTQLDVNGSKPGGRIEVDTELLVRVLERLTSGSAVEGSQPDAAQSLAGEPTDKPEAEPALGQEVEAGVEPVPEQGLEAASGARLDPVMPDAKDPKAKQPTDTGKPAAGKVPSAASPAQGKDPTQQPKPGQEGKPQAKPGAPGAKEPGGTPEQAAAAGVPASPDGGEGMPPGMAAPGAKPEPEMTPERASEILQPYADHSQVPEGQTPKTESDLLYTRLGEEKDVQAAVSDQDPMDVLDDIEAVVGGGKDRKRMSRFGDDAEGGKPNGGDSDEVEGPAQPEDGDVTDASADKPRRRERLADPEGNEDKPQLRGKPKGMGRRRFRL